VDGKGRVSIPATFRRVVEKSDPEWTDGGRPNLVIVYGTSKQKHLDCYTMNAIEEIDARIAKMQPGSLERTMVERNFNGFSMDVQIDEDGRIVLAARLRAKIGLDNEAFFIASGDHFEVWKPETYEQDALAKAEAWMDGFPEGFDPRALLPELSGAQ
jgi:MraZ protein